MGELSECALFAFARRKRRLLFNNLEVVPGVVNQGQAVNKPGNELPTGLP